MVGELRLVVDARAILGEGPCWDAQRHLLYWVDVLGQKVHGYHPETRTDWAIDVGQYIGAAVPRRAGGLVLAMQHGFFALDTETASLTCLHDPEADRPNNRFNDGKCDAAGRLWAGTMPMTGSAPAGTLYCLHPNGDVRPVLEHVSCLWVAQWGGYQVARWDPATGRRLEVVKLPVAHVSSCAFGGERLDDLYITTARNGLDEATLSQQPLAGGVFCV